MTTMSDKKLTKTQNRVLELLPATIDELANDLDVSESTIHDHIKGLRDAGIPVRNGDGRLRYIEGDVDDGSSLSESSLSTPVSETETPEPAYLSPGEKAAITRSKNEYIADLSQRTRRLVEESRQLAETDGGRDTLASETPAAPSNEDVVIHRSDDHIGAEVYDEYGNLVYNVDIAKKRAREVTNAVIDLVEREAKADREFDTAHLLLGGDTVTGENIYSHQPHEIEYTLDKQIDIAAQLYFEQIEKLVPHFKHVQVVCQSGNHGEIRGAGFSAGLNADDIVYNMLEHMVRLSGLENVSFVRNEALHFTNFTMRGGKHRGHLRHGQHSLPHIGTASAQNKWRGWLTQHGFDIAYRGHYHEFKLEHVMNRPVLMSGSICPPSDFEESLSVWSEPAATVHGVTDDYPLAWVYPVYFNRD